MSEQEMEMSFDLEGNLAGSGTNYRKFDRLKIEKDTTVVGRVLPPFGTNHGKMLYHKYETHWGFTTESGGKKPVSCSYSEERFCPVCTAVREAENELESYKDKKTGKYTGAPKERVDELKAYIMAFSSNRFLALNFYTYDGRFVILELKKTAVDELMGKISEAIKKYKFDPISLTSGVWFEISRTGEKLKTKYHVNFKKILKKTNEGEDAEVNDRTPLPPEVVAQIKEQMESFAGTTKGPMYDIHVLHEPSTAAELQGYMDGNPVPGGGRPKADDEAAAPATEAAASEEAAVEEPGEEPQVDYATEAPTPEPEQSKPPVSAKPPTRLSPPPTQAAKPAAAATTKPPTQAPKPAIANAQAEIARLRQMAGQGGAKTGAKAGG